MTWGWFGFNYYLMELLAGYERDPHKINLYLDNIKEVIKDEAEIDNMLFGGSVAKHTYVDGLSDVDALVVINDSDLEGKSPSVALESLYKMLNNKLTFESIKEITKGKMAVTITYDDETEIQLLPSIKSGETYSIPNTDVNKWNQTNPKMFQSTLTTANEKINNILVPSIKLYKSIVSNFSEKEQLTGYHAEAICIESIKGYRGEKTVQSTIVQLFKESSQRILNPIKDITGQSRNVDDYLGNSNSTERKAISKTLNKIANKLESAVTVRDWSKIIED